MTPRTRLTVTAGLATALTTSSLGSVFSDLGWLLPVLGAIMAVVVGAEVGAWVGTRLALAPLWRLLGSVVALTLYTCAAFAGDHALLGLLPSAGAVSRLRALVGQALDDIRQLAAPVPSHRGLVLVTVLGVGAVAILVDTLSSRAALTGLPLLALYSVPEWLSPHGAGWAALLLGGSGYVTLLIREGRERTNRWGRTISGPVELGTTAAGAVSQAGWRIGAAALGVALVVPPLVPGIDHARVFGQGGNGPGSGHSSVTTYNPITSLYGNLTRGDEVDQLSYRTTDTTPGYLRWTTLDRFDGSTWSPSELKGDAGTRVKPGTRPSTPIDPALAQTPVTTSIDVTDDLDIRWLPVPPAPVNITHLDGSWWYDGTSDTIFSSHTNTRGLSYVVQSTEADPTQAQLEAATVPLPTDADNESHYLALPDIPASVRSITDKITQRWTTPYEKALALQHYFTDGSFTYSTHASGNGTRALETFLADRQGFCEQFASAMAVMARIEQIPARVAIGFTPGNRQPDGSYRVTNYDAHAWPELYFKGIGWVRFEPTPRGDGQTTIPDYAIATPAQVGNSSSTVPQTGSTGQNQQGTQHRTTGHGFSPLERANPAPPNAVTALPPVAAPQHSLSVRSLALIALGCALLAVLLSLPLIHLVGRRRRHRQAAAPAARAHAAWSDVMTDAYDLGHRFPASDSPRQAVRRLAGLAALPAEPLAALHRLARSEERARYAATMTEVGAIDDDAAVVSAALFAHAPRAVRIRARLVPPSTVHALSSTIGARVADGLDWLDGARSSAVGALLAPLRRSRST